MARVLLDTNALIDMVVARYPERYEAIGLVVDRFLESRGDELYVSPLSIKDMTYFLENNKMMKTTIPSAARRSMFAFEARESAFDTCTICTIDKQLAWAAHDDQNEQNYDDALIAACAEKYKVDAIISSDKRAFRKSKVKSMTPEEAAKYFAKN